jgi:hypothetical protein
VLPLDAADEEDHCLKNIANLLFLGSCSWSLIE